MSRANMALRVFCNKQSAPPPPPQQQGRAFILTRKSFAFNMAARSPLMILCRRNSRKLPSASIELAKKLPRASTQEIGKFLLINYRRRIRADVAVRAGNVAHPVWWSPPPGTGPAPHPAPSNKYTKSAKKQKIAKINE